MSGVVVVRSRTPKMAIAHMQALTEANTYAQATWNNRACGMRRPDDLNLLKDGSFYKEIARRRYFEDDPWIPAVLDFPSMKGKQVLEIGHGMGCDLATAAINGAITHGIDLTPNHHEIAKRNFASLGLAGDFHLGNAGELPFANESMDIVYSIGVLHHTDNAEQCVAEAYRVLRPGGRFVMSLYNFWSAAHLLYIVDGLRTGKLRKLGYRNFLCTIEGGADGVNIKPMVKLYSARQVRAMLKSFREVDVSYHGFNQRGVPLIGRYLNDKFGAAVARHWGWYVTADSRKKARG